MSQIRDEALRELSTTHSTGDIREQPPCASPWTGPQRDCHLRGSLRPGPPAFATRRSSDKPANRYCAELSRHRVLQTQTRRTELNSSWQVPSAQTNTEQSAPPHVCLRLRLGQSQQGGTLGAGLPCGVVLACVCVCVCALGPPVLDPASCLSVSFTESLSWAHRQMALLLM